MSEKQFCVYKHTTPNGKVYIGITSLSPERRWNRGSGYRNQPLFYRAIQKYGWDNICHEVVVEHLSKDEASEMEMMLIDKYKSTDPKHGYNLTGGGFGGAIGTTNSTETRRRKSESAKRAWANPNKNGPKKLPVVNGVKMRKGYTGLGHSKKAVSQDTLDGVHVKTWSSLCEIERELGIPTGKISECCNGKRMSTKGYKWSFAEVVA